MIIEYGHHAKEPTTLMAVGTLDSEPDGIRRNIDYIGAAAIGGFALALVGSLGYKKAAPYVAIAGFLLTLKYLAR